MSRTKKSRKPGGAPTAKPKLSKQELAKVEKRVRKTTGKQAGNRQKEATQEKASNSQQGANKDPRLGNKTPIALGKLAAKAEKTEQAKIKQASQNTSTIAGVRFAEKSTVELTPEQAINAIEQDETLQDILAKIAEDIALTEQEVNYYNELMEKHQALSESLDLDDSDEEDVADTRNEEALWDKLDSHDFSDFEEKE